MTAIGQFTAGDAVTVRRRVSIEDIDQFVLLSGDNSAIHVSAEAAASQGFAGRVVHGVLLTSWVSAIIGTKLPGNCGVLQTINMSFRSPVVPPDEVELTVAVSGKSEAVSQLKLSIRIVKSDGTVAATGEARSIVK